MYRSIRNFYIPQADTGNLNFLKSGFSNSPPPGQKCVQMPHRNTENYEKLQYKRHEIPSHYTRYIIMNQVHESGRLYMSRETI